MEQPTLPQAFDLFVRIEPSEEGLWDKIAGWFSGEEAEPAIATLSIDERRLWFAYKDRPDGVRELDLTQPFSLQLSHWSNDNGDIELNLALRQLGASLETPSILLRVLWPLARVSQAEIPRQKSHGRFVRSADFLDLWRILEHFAQHHGTALPGGFELDVDPDEFKGLGSEYEEVVCMACGSHHLRFLHVDFYQCEDCGYEGGRGQAEALEKRAAATYQAMEPEQRLRLALDDLTEVHRLMLSAAGAAANQIRRHNRPRPVHQASPAPNEIQVMNRNHVLQCQERAVHLLKQAALKLPQAPLKELTDRIKTEAYRADEHGFEQLAAAVKAQAAALRAP